MSSSSVTASLTAVPYVGTGVVVLAVVWGVAILLMVSTAFLRGGAGFLPVILFILATIITVALLFTPRTSPSKPIDVSVYDYFWVARVVLLVILSFFVLIGLVFMIIGHATQVVHAKAVKSKFA